jgi:hypothetical protein
MPTLLRTRPVPGQIVLAAAVSLGFAMLAVRLSDPALLLAAIVAAIAAPGVVLVLGDKSAEREEKVPDDARFSLKRIKRSELIGFLGAAVIVFSLFALPWFATSCASPQEAQAARGPGDCNPNSKIKTADNRLQYGEFTGWETYKYLRWALLAACLAPFILAYIIARGHELEWRPGEITMIVGMVALALILLDGIILGTPGGARDYNVDVSLQIGYLVGLVGALLICVGGFRRQAENIKAGPPGV